MSTQTAPSGKAAALGIVAGVLLLGVVLVFAILLPRVADADDTGSAVSDKPLVLPDTIAGGYTATDLPAAYATPPANLDTDAIQKAQVAERDYADQVLGSVLQEPAVSRTYATADLMKLVSVQAFRADGGAVAPPQVYPPTTQNPTPPQTLVRQGDAVCILQYQADQNGGISSTPAIITCQRSGDGITVQVTGAALTTEDVAAVTDSVFGGLA